MWMCNYFHGILSIEFPVPKTENNLPLTEFNKSVVLDNLDKIIFIQRYYRKLKKFKLHVKQNLEIAFKLLRINVYFTKIKRDIASLKKVKTNQINLNYVSCNDE